MSTRKAWLLAASLIATALLPGPAQARGGHYHGGPRVGVYIGPSAPYWGPRHYGPRYYPPPAYYLPPPVVYVPPPITYYAPPPVYYAPPPATWPSGQPYIPGYVPITPPPATRPAAPRPR